MGKLTIILYGFVIAVLSLFSTFVYLMTTVNPDRLPNLPSDGEPTTTTELVTPVTTAESDSESAELMKLLDIEGEPRAVTTATHSVTPVATAETASKPAGLMKLLDIEAEERTSVDQKTMNLTDTKKPKGRRSINQRRKKNRGVVIMKIVDTEGKPRIEIVLYPKNNDWKRYKRLNALESKRTKTDLLGHSILNIMPDDSIVFENKGVSCNRDLEHELTLSAAISDKAEATEKVCVKYVKNNNSNLIKPSGHNKKVTKLYSVSPLENPHETVTPKMEMDTNSNEKQTESITDVFVDKRDDLLNSTSPNFNTAGWNIANIGISKTESGLGINVSEEVTEINTILLSPTQDTSIESLQGNVTTEMNMNFTEKLHAISNEDISTRKTDNLLNSTSLNDNTASWDEKVSIDQNESNTDVFDPEDQEINFTIASNLNNGETKPNEFITSVQDTSTIEGSHANITIAMDMDFSEEVQAKPYTDKYLNVADNLFHSTGTNFSTVSFIQEDIGINNNKSNSDVIETKDLGSILTTSIFSETETKSNTVLMSPVQDTSPIGSENVTPKMDFSEELQTTSHEDVSVKDTDNLFDSTSTNVNNVTSDEADIV